MSLMCKAGDVLTVFVTVPNVRIARAIARSVISKREAACVSVVPRIYSMYWWKGRIESSSESLMIMKTRKALFRRLEKTVKRLHPYEVPEVVALAVAAGSQSYLGWVDDETRSVKRSSAIGARR